MFPGGYGIAWTDERRRAPAKLARKIHVRCHERTPEEETLWVDSRGDLAQCRQVYSGCAGIGLAKLGDLEHTEGRDVAVHTKFPRLREYCGPFAAARIEGEAEDEVERWLEAAHLGSHLGHDLQVFVPVIGRRNEHRERPGRRRLHFGVAFKERVETVGDDRDA